QSNPVSVNSPLSVQCYPSPVTTVVTLSGLPDDMQVILADQAGIPVLETTDHTIDVAWLPAGIYFVLNKQGEVLSRFVHE
ncbi:MAG TPA: T9SS type A sorting domain-containing protein, partial [Chitinophagales bacterium]|nr:T9SS type A sorting domain-containing protein [Chitinophagales bacterium]